MVGFMNAEAWDITKQTGYVTFFSRTRNKLWTKGETSGNRLAVRDSLHRLRRRHRAGEGGAARRRQRVPHGRPHLLLEARGRSHHPMKLKLGLPKGSLQDATDSALRAGRVQHLRQHALLFPVHRRSRDRVHADPRAGDDALRVRGRARRRTDRPGLGGRAQVRPARAHVRDEPGRPGLLEAELRQGQVGAGRAGRLAIHQAHGLRRRRDRDRAGAGDQALLRQPGREGEARGVLVGRHRGEAAGAGRRDRRGHRDRIHAASQPAAHPGYGDGVEHAAHRQPDGDGRRLEEAEDRQHRAAAQGRHRGAGPRGADAEREAHRPAEGAGAAAGAAASRRSRRSATRNGWP